MQFGEQKPLQPKIENAGISFRKYIGMDFNRSQQRLQKEKTIWI